MKSSVQLGLLCLCLSLFISSLHGEEEVKTDASMQMPILFDEPDLHQFEMYRVRRQTVSTEQENPALAIVPPRENSRTHSKIRKPKRPGGLSVVGRIEKPEEPMQTAKVEMDAK